MKTNREPIQLIDFNSANQFHLVRCYYSTWLQLLPQSNRTVKNVRTASSEVSITSAVKVSAKVYSMLHV